MKRKRDFREGVIGLSRGIIWLVVSLWVVVTSVVGIIRNAPIGDFVYTVVIGGLVLFIAGNIIASLGVNYIVASIVEIREKRRKERLEEFENMVVGGEEVEIDGESETGSAVQSVGVEGDVNQ